MRRAGLVGLVALVTIVWPFVVPPYVVFLTTLILVNGIVAIGLNLLTGYTNQLSFGHAGFVAIGAYTGALVTIHAPDMPVPFTLLLAGLVTALVGLALGIPCLRLEGLYLAMATLAFGVVVLEAILNLDWLTRGADGLRVPPPSLVTSGIARYFLVAAVTVVMVAAAMSLVRTRTGRAFLAIRESEIAAQASGVDVARYKTVAFVVSAFYTGVGGGLFAFVVGFLSPDGFDVFVSVDYLVMVIVGGLASVPGSLVGAAVVTLLNDWLARFQNYRPLIFGAALVAVMLFMPGGIASAAAGFNRFNRHGGLRAPPKPPIGARGAHAPP